MFFLKSFASAHDVINEERINVVLKNKGKSDKSEVREILQKAECLEGLDIDEAAVLINVDDEESLAEIFKTAKTVKEKIYGNRIVLFAPLYLTSQCVNNCLYCAFRKDNNQIDRMALSPEQIKMQVESIVGMGHKRLLLVCGEHPQYSALDYIGLAVDTAYKVAIGNGRIRRVHVNAAPFSVDEFKTLKSFNIGVYQSFQETYHKETYKMMHPSGPKADYEWRLLTMHRAFEAGLGDVGMGILYGLYDYKFELLATLMHCRSLEESYGVGPHTISIPRIEPAKGVPFSMNPPYAVSDADFKKLVAILRLSVPFTGIILTTRERPELRNECLHLGVSQISAGSKTQPGGYVKKMDQIADEDGQFFVADHRSLEEIVGMLCKEGFLPSFCASCYRAGRTGEDFMSLSKPGDIKNFCSPNALSTFKEYLEDYASLETKSAGEKIIVKTMNSLSPELVETSEKLLSRIAKGERDCYI